jgi:hypothetical protein
MNYIDRLIKNCQAAKEATPIQEFVVSDLSALDGIGKAIYIIEQTAGEPEKTFAEFMRYKEKKERSCAKLNAPSMVMYVGSSTSGVKKRIEQHVGQGHEKTFALHLSHWYSGSYKIIVKQYDVPNDVLQIIEDDMSDRLKPAFGKKGSNNK